VVAITAKTSGDSSSGVSEIIFHRIHDSFTIGAPAGLEESGAGCAGVDDSLVREPPAGGLKPGPISRVEVVCGEIRCLMRCSATMPS
jgi:hypothetical protein